MMKDLKLEKMRHSCAHLMASAVKKLRPAIKIAIGPTVEDGFYYDFDFEKPLGEDDLPRIEKKMEELKKKDFELRGEWITTKKARQLFKDNSYKLEIIDEIEKGVRSDFGQKGKVSIYQTGDFVDLCKGPHVKKTSQIGPFKLLSISGAYWRGDEKNKMLTRIYGTCFPTKKELANHLWQIEEAKKRDHRKLGRRLGLFILPQDVGSGLVIWLPKGAVIRSQIEKLIVEEQIKRGYKHVYSPHIGKKSLWLTSGHWDLYRDKMYPAMKADETEYLVKPMNCPMHIKVYQSALRSYRDLPLRIAEIATVYRREQLGELTGLARVRQITQDDAHIFCRKDQVRGEFKKVIDLAIDLLTVFGISKYEIWLSVRDPQNKNKYLGDDKVWREAESEIIKAVDEKNMKVEIKEGEAAFYGPKLDILIKDALGRRWQCTTIQVDFMLPKRFNLRYINEKGEQKQVAMIHRAILGALERFMAILIEHFAGAFPLWLSPVQVIILPVSDKFKQLAAKVLAILKRENVRAELDHSSQTLPYKIRQATLQKIPFMCIIGEKEVKKSKKEDRERKNLYVSVRTQSGEDLGIVNLYEFLPGLKRKIEKKL